LLCNGASVSKSDYSALYNVIGDSSGLSSLGAGKPWQSQCGFNPSTQNDITGWTSTNSLANSAHDAASLVTKNYMYILGGYNSNGALNSIQRASFDSNGNLSSTWSNVGTLPTKLGGTGYVATKDRIYLIAGSDGSSFLTSVYSAPINTDGTLGAFRAETSLPDKRVDTACFVIKDKLYVVGGLIDTSFKSADTVYRTTINNDGTLNSWETLPNFPISFGFGRPLLIKDRIYIFEVRNYDTKDSRIYYATYDSNGNIGSWTYVLDTSNIYGSAMVCTDNYVFKMGGGYTDKEQFIAVSYRAPILIDGSIGDWTQISDAPIAVIHPQTVIAGNKIYFIGGTDNNHTQIQNVYSATFTSGIADYTQYYTDQSNAASTSSTFNLPDLTSRSNASPKMKYIIKT
jgi:N-acetylneuraminic acid mutarotase